MKCPGLVLKGEVPAYAAALCWTSCVLEPMNIAYASAEDPDTAEGIHLPILHPPMLRPKQRNRSERTRTRVSKSGGSSNKPPMVKRRKSCDTKWSLSDASPTEREEISEDEDKPDAICQGYTLVDADAICQGYTLVNADDKESIISYYHFCLVNIGAILMKKILKAWIKVIHYKKQVTHPYKYREYSKPDWWPSATDDPDSGCRHIEPDHLHNNG